MENGFSRGTRGLGRLGGLAVGVSLAFGTAALAAPKGAIKQMAEHVPGELVVKLKGFNARAQKDRVYASSLRASAIASLEASLEKTSQAKVLSVQPFETDGSLQTIRISDDKALSKAMQGLVDSGQVEYAEPNFIYRTQLTGEAGEPNDADFAQLWGMHNFGQKDAAGQVGTAGSDIQVLPLWSQGITGSRNVVVAIIDTGIDWTHPDLAANVFVNTGEIAGNGIDDDKNGFIDDVHGWNFENNTADAKDDHNHGSHCAGTIGAEGNNGKGVAGVNWAVRMMPVKFLSATGSGSLDGAVNSINYATMMKVNVMSNSWGGGGFSRTMKEAIEKARDQGILFVAAAGNDTNNNDVNPTYPAGYEVDNVVSVAASDNQDKIAVFSNYGARTVHVSAPGVKILSTVRNGGYLAYSGTSMATPHTAGTAALLWSHNPNWTYADIKDRLIKTSVPVRGLKKKSISKGRINAYNALNGIVPPTDEPDDSKWETVDFAVESEHPYKDKADLKYNVKFTGAQYIRVIFEKVEVELNYDKVFVEEPAGLSIDEVTGNVANYTTDYVKGDQLVIRLKSDDSVPGWGFKVRKIQIIR